MAGFLDLKNAKRIWHGGQEVTRLWAGRGAWVKPVTAPASIFSLTAAQAGKSGFSVTDATDTGIKLNRATTARGWVSWAVNWPVGSRVVFNWTTSPSVHMYSGLDDVVGLGSLNHVIVNAVGQGSVNYIIPAGGGWNYFGFSVSNGQAAGLVTISNLGVYAP
jgi:hypothetical protein